MSTSKWSTEAWTDTLSDSGGSVILIDDFSSYPNGQRLNSVTPPGSEFGWDYAVGDSGCIPEVNSGALSFTYAAGAHWSEQRFEFGRYIQNLTLEYDLFIPANYQHRTGSGSANNKFLRLYGETTSISTSRQNCGASLWRVNDDQSQLYIDGYNGGMGSIGSPDNDFIAPADYGTWIAVKYTVKAPTASTNGEMTVYKNGTQVCYASVDNYMTGIQQGYISGYLLGYHNTGYSEDTTFLIDNVVMREGAA